jgi:type I restriction enzyme M protein
MAKQNVDDESPAVEPIVGQIVDFISGQLVRETPEETDAVQVFSRRLVEDYGYLRSQIQTRPQFRVRKSPSDESKTYPVDIAVFQSASRIEENLAIIVECKKKNRKDGLAQLKLYLDMSPAEIGVWFNGDDHAYIQKVLSKEGRTWNELPNIPRKGQRVEDIGQFRRKDLRAPSNLKAVFRDLRNHLAGNTTGIVRDEALAQEIINLLFCKIYDEINTAMDDAVTFRCGIGESPAEVKKRIVGIFEKSVKAEYRDVFAATDSLKLDAESVLYVVGELQNYCIVDADRDAVGDAFEVFIGPALRGGEGQFFTPRNVVKMVVEMLDPSPGDMVIDPACGSGGFLIATLEYVWKKLEAQAKRHGWSESQLERKRRDVASKCFRGLDKDSFLAKVTKAYMAIIGDGRGGVFCENSLLPPPEWHSNTRDMIATESFDVVLTNPPFGSKIHVKGSTVLTQYALGHKWKRDGDTGLPVQTTTLHDEQSPHILFIERCLQLLKPGGRLGIVMPESILGNPSYAHVIAFIMTHARVNAVVTMPEALFKTSGKGGTHTKVCVLLLEKTTAASHDYSMFMADAKWCGHDSRGNPTIRRNEKGLDVVLDDVPEIARKYSKLKKTEAGSRLGFWIRVGALKNRVLVPKYYNPELDTYVESLRATHDMLLIGDLIADKTVSVITGIEIGKMAYGTGTIPFVRTSDFSNWEIKADFKHGVSEAIYDACKTGIDVKAGDILLVRDGTYLIGTTAILTESDLPMLFQSHIYRIRVEKPSVIDPWLLFACLNSQVVKKQIRSKQFTQDIIDTLGRRLAEVAIPFPKDAALRKRIALEVKKTVQTRAALRDRTSELAREVEGLPTVAVEDE